jgi:glucosamine 6-phosphate synthetase-like amidotransferase/phosphosugar isomerase protein
LRLTVFISLPGTSYNAGYASKYLLEELTEKPVELGIASEWGYNMPRLSKNHSLFSYHNQVKPLIAVKF